MLLGQLVKKVDALDLDMKEQKEQMREVVAKQRDQMNTPPPKPTVVVDSTVARVEQTPVALAVCMPAAWAV